MPDTTLPTTLQGNVQVQGDSHLLVHIQEGITASDNHSGGAGVRGPIGHLGLIVVVGVCCILFVTLLVHQLLRCVNFRPRTVEVVPGDPLVEDHHRVVMEAQLRGHMGLEMRKFLAQRALEVETCQGLRGSAGEHPALLAKTVGTESRGLVLPTCAQEALGFSRVGGAPQGSMAPFQAIAPVFPHQAQALGLGMHLLIGRCSGTTAKVMNSVCRNLGIVSTGLSIRRTCFVPRPQCLSRVL